MRWISSGFVACLALAGCCNNSTAADAGSTASSSSGASSGTSTSSASASAGSNGGGSSHSTGSSGNGGTASSGSWTSVGSSGSGSTQGSSGSGSTIGSSGTSESSSGSGTTVESSGSGTIGSSGSHASGASSGSGTSVGSSGSGASGSSGSGTTVGSSGSSGSSSGAVHTIALVDNDGYVGDGSGTDATVLAAYEGWLANAGITAYDVITVDATGSQSWNPNVVPSATQLAQYDTVIWMAADNSVTNINPGDTPLSSDQETILAGWLSAGGKKLAIFSEFLVSDDFTASYPWVTAPTDPLFATYLLAQGGEDNPYEYVAGTSFVCAPIDNAPFSVAAGSSEWTIGASSVLTANIPSFTAGTLNEPSGVDVLASVEAEPTTGPNWMCSGSQSVVPVAVGKKNAGGTTSTVVYVGVEPMNIQSGSATAQQFVDAILQTYLGLP